MTTPALAVSGFVGDPVSEREGYRGPIKILNDAEKEGMRVVCKVLGFSWGKDSIAPLSDTSADRMALPTSHVNSWRVRC
jgi:hypothetical protein